MAAPSLAQKLVKSRAEFRRSFVGAEIVGSIRSLFRCFYGLASIDTGKLGLKETLLLGLLYLIQQIRQTIHPDLPPSPWVSSITSTTLLVIIRSLWEL